MSGISSKALAFSKENKKGYAGNEIQNKEFSDGSGLDFYDFNARTYDQQIGRFLQIDPLSEEDDQEDWSPYHYSYNNPISFSDPDGKLPVIPLI
ncbi:MAG TPA: RHS repeat-associated core domain-containing protein, partial [Chitinophagaceae bacterium]|nr:RHS repeat-associated core domain-containing protein [Chitinophagaceae bacterium]